MEEGGRGAWAILVWRVTCTCCPSTTLCLPVAVTFHSAQSQVPAPLPRLVANVPDPADFRHSEMSHADFSWE